MLLLFFADLLAAVWPEFDALWKAKAHLGVAFAAFMDVLVSEYFHDEHEPQRRPPEAEEGETQQD